MVQRLHHMSQMVSLCSVRFLLAMSLARCTVAMSLLFDDTNHPRIGNKEGIDQWPFQKPKLEVPTVYGLYEANVREYPNKIWPYLVQYLHFRILKFPLIFGCELELN